ncbi:MAG: hypothetical protein ABEN55_21035 [Bradymonadaceae bacterium]
MSHEHKPSVFCPTCMGEGEVVYRNARAAFLDYEQDADGEIVIEDGARLNKGQGPLDCLECGGSFRPKELRWGPYFYLVGLDETDAWISPVIEAHAHKLVTVYLFDRSERTYTCSMSPSYFLYPLHVQIVECDEAHADEVAEAVRSAPLGDGSYHNQHTIESIIEDDDAPSKFLGHCGHDRPDTDDELIYEVSTHIHSPYFQ